MIKVLRLLKYFLGSGHSLCAWLLANEIARIHCLALGRSRALDINRDRYVIDRDLRMRSISKR